MDVFGTPSMKLTSCLFVLAYWSAWTPPANNDSEKKVNALSFLLETEVWPTDFALSRASTLQEGPYLVY